MNPTSFVSIIECGVFVIGFYATFTLNYRINTKNLVEILPGLS